MIEKLFHKILEHANISQFLEDLLTLKCHPGNMLGEPGTADPAVNGKPGQELPLKASRLSQPDSSI